MLAGERVDLPALAASPWALETIAGALADDASVVLYGCSVAAGPAGRNFLFSLEACLGVAVAASDGPVGSATQGGRWNLRGRDGAAFDPAFAPAARAAFPGLLATRPLAKAYLHCQAQPATPLAAALPTRCTRLGLSAGSGGGAGVHRARARAAA